MHMLLDRRVEGMIFISCEMTNLSGDHDHYAQLLDEGAKLVFVNGALNQLDVPSVGVDERAAGEIATQHLLDLGHERIGFVAGPEHYLPTHRRGRAASGDARRRARPGRPDRARRLQRRRRQRAHRGAARRCATPPTGVICSSDLMAIGVLHEAARRGVDVPGELSVVGFDGIEATTWTVPALTTVEQPIAQIADTAVRDARDADRGPVAALAELVLQAGAARACVDRAAHTDARKGASRRRLLEV